MDTDIAKHRAEALQYVWLNAFNSQQSYFTLECASSTKPVLACSRVPFFAEAKINTEIV